MSSGFIEIEGGTQPALPSSGKARLWFNTATNRQEVLLSDGTSIPLSDIVSETENQVLGPNDSFLVYDAENSTYRKITGKNLSPLAIQNRYLTYDEDEFLGTTSNGKLNWTASVSGTGASAQAGSYGVNGTERALGVLQLDTGITATGRAYLNRAIGLLQMGYCSFDQTWRLAVEELSDATNRFQVAFGFHDNSGAGEATDGVYFRYKDDVNSGQWQCVCREGSIETVVNTSVTVNTIYNRFRIVVNETATEALFYINDVLVATILTNLPSTGGALTGIACKIEKFLGTTQRNISIDYFTQKCEWSTGR